MQQIKAVQQTFVARGFMFTFARRKCLQASHTRTHTKKRPKSVKTQEICGLSTKNNNTMHGGPPLPKGLDLFWEWFLFFGNLFLDLLSWNWQVPPWVLPGLTRFAPALPTSPASFQGFRVGSRLARVGTGWVPGLFRESLGVGAL